jgi:hypothetical protein
MDLVGPSSFRISNLPFAEGPFDSAKIEAGRTRPDKRAAINRELAIPLTTLFI